MNKILVINPFGIGDVLFSMVLVEALRSSLPQTSIGFMGNERTIELLRMNPHIDVCHEFNRDEWRARRKDGLLPYLSRGRAYLKEIRTQRYDTLFDLSLGREFSFAGFLSGIGRRIGFDHKRRGFFLTHRTVLQSYDGMHVADRQLLLLRHIGLEPKPVSSRLPLNISEQAKKNAADLLVAQGIGPQDKFLVLVPGGGRSWGENAIYKQWSPERFAAAANARALGAEVRTVLLGDAGERSLLSSVRSRLEGSSALVAGESLATVCAILRRAGMVLGNDGGLLHLANALGVKTVSIYGPVDENVYGPYGKQTPHEILSQAVPCRPCYKNFHFPPCAHQRRCLEELTVEKVLAGMKKIS